MRTSKLQTLFDDVPMAGSVWSRDAARFRLPLDGPHLAAEILIAYGHTRAFVEIHDRRLIARMARSGYHTDAKFAQRPLHSPTDVRTEMRLLELVAADVHVDLPRRRTRRHQGQLRPFEDEIFQLVSRSRWQWNWAQVERRASMRFERGRLWKIVAYCSASPTDIDMIVSMWPTRGTATGRDLRAAEAWMQHVLPAGYERLGTRSVWFGKAPRSAADARRERARLDWRLFGAALLDAGVPREYGRRS